MSYHRTVRTFVASWAPAWLPALVLCTMAPTALAAPRPPVADDGRIQVPVVGQFGTPTRTSVGWDSEEFRKMAASRHRPLVAVELDGRKWLFVLVGAELYRANASDNFSEWKIVPFAGAPLVNAQGLAVLKGRLFTTADEGKVGIYSVALPAKESAAEWSWTRIADAPDRRGGVVSDGEALYVTAAQNLYRSQDGVTWSKVTPSPVPAAMIWSLTVGPGWHWMFVGIGGRRTTVMQVFSSPDGVTWKKVRDFPVNDVGSCDLVASANAVTAACYERAERLVAGGEWTTVGTSSAARLPHTVHGEGAMSLWFGPKQQIATTDGGATWQAINSVEGVLWYRISDAQLLLVSGGGVSVRPLVPLEDKAAAPVPAH